jgi:uncharacterized protein YndB with AHSA1/START domain
MHHPALHRAVTRTLRVARPPADVFPLLCPVREREWIPGWSADVLHSESGLAELGCVFVAHLGEGRDATYVVTEHAPPRRIAFAIFDGDAVETLAIDVREAGGGSELDWARAATATTAAGAARIEASYPGGVYDRLGALERMLQDFFAAR